MFEKQNIQETVNELKSDAVKGLTDGEAFRRLQQNGRNEMKAARKKTKIQLFLEQLKDPLIYILLIAAVVSVFLGELSDAVIIGTVVVVNDQKLQSAGRGIRPDRRIGTCGKRCAVSGRLQTRDSIG